ncbi:unnamed protein product [Paramecium pentaurelia]|uniref:F-BAR domain-containing protein n=1 Tax=Paramecium pentaurelia TaxID=43138 RepID=A0A8S1UR91_9CILI|nr:unnamed protein product [Paramecium pentaurelia]
MLYSQQLKNKAQAIISNTNLGWQQTGIICDCLQDRYEIEMKYSKAIEKLATKLAPLNEFFSASFGIRAQLSSQFAEEIKGEIELIKQLLVQQKATQYIEFVKLWDSQLQSIKSNVKSAEGYLKNKKREYEIEGALELVFSACQPEKLEKQKYKAAQCKKEYLLAKENYLEVKLEMQQILNEQEAETTLDQIQQLNLQRLNTIKDCILKVFVYESSIAKNYLYDLEKMSDRLHDQDQNQFIEEFIKKTKQQETYNIELESFLTKLLDMQGQQQINTTNIYPIGLDKTEEQIQQETKEIQESLQKQEEFLNFLSQKFHSNTFQLTQQEFIQCTNISNGILDYCYENKNAILAQQLLQYSFGLFTKDNQTKYMQNMLVNHQIWQYRDYWESVIINQISKIKKGTKENINCSILSILTQVAQHMLMFKLLPDLVRDIVQKFSQFFKLNKEIADDLIQAINSQI